MNIKKGILMSKFIKTALSILILGASSTAVFAEDLSAAKPGGSNNQGGAHQGGGTQTGGSNCGSGRGTETCSGQIPIYVTVPTLCELQVETDDITFADGGTGTGTFNVKSNAQYKMKLTTDNNSNARYSENGTIFSIPLNITTTGNGGVNYDLNQEYQNIPRSFTGSQYTVSVTNAAVGISKPAGTYKENYNIAVYF